MRPTVGRLANAMIAALGPELRRGSPPYNQCRAVIREMQVGCGLLTSLHACQIQTAEEET